MNFLYNERSMNPTYNGEEQGGMNSLPRRIHALYRDGFRSMLVGRTLWKIIFLKLFIMFAILKVFFFPNYLATQFTNDSDRANHVLNNLIGTQPNR